MIIRNFGLVGAVFTVHSCNIAHCVQYKKTLYIYMTISEESAEKLPH